MAKDKDKKKEKEKFEFRKLFAELGDTLKDTNRLLRAAIYEKELRDKMRASRKSSGLDDDGDDAQALAMEMDGNLKPKKTFSIQRRNELVHECMKLRYGVGYNDPEAPTGWKYKLQKPWDHYISAGPGANSFDDEVTEYTRNMMALHGGSNKISALLIKLNSLIDDDEKIAAGIKSKPHRKEEIEKKEKAEAECANFISNFYSKEPNKVSFDASTLEGKKKILKYFNELDFDLNQLYTQINVDRHQRNEGLKTRPFREKGWALHGLVLKAARDERKDAVEEIKRAFKNDPNDPGSFRKGFYKYYFAMVLHASSMRRLNQGFLSKTEHPALTFFESLVKLPKYVFKNLIGLPINLFMTALAVLNPLIFVPITVAKYVGRTLGGRVLLAGIAAFGVDYGVPTADKALESAMPGLHRVLHNKIGPLTSPLLQWKSDTINNGAGSVDNFFNGMHPALNYTLGLPWRIGKVTVGVYNWLRPEYVRDFWAGTHSGNTPVERARNTINTTVEQFGNYSALEMLRMIRSPASQEPVIAARIVEELKATRVELAQQVKISGNLSYLPTLDLREDGSTPLKDYIFPPTLSGNTSCDRAYSVIHSYLKNPNQLVPKPDKEEIDDIRPDGSTQKILVSKFDFQSQVRPEDFRATFDELAKRGCLSKPQGYTPTFYKNLLAEQYKREQNRLN